jgi:hypothetical protein
VLVAGSWWDPDYAGPLLVSVEEDAARGLGVAVGDTIGFRIAGREVTAAVASTAKRLSSATREPYAPASLGKREATRVRRLSS